MSETLKNAPTHELSPVAPERQRSLAVAVWIAVAIAALPLAVWVVMKVMPGPFDAAWSFILDGQREMTRGMSTAVRDLKTQGSVPAALVLGLLSFLYGVLHAVGPGHGKFVISSYALANEKTVRRGVLLSFMAALIQALSAIAIVGILALILKATSLQIKATEAWLETASWALIALLGAWLLWGQLSRTERPVDLHASRHVAPRHGQSHQHADEHRHGRVHGAGETHRSKVHQQDAVSGHVHGPACNHADEPAHVHDEHCGHTHMATPQQLEGEWRWSHAWSLALSIGIRPCTGAIGVLLLSLSLGIFWAGIFATFTMAIGTALTVSALAAMAVWSRELAARVAGGADSRLAAIVQRSASIGGSALVMVIGLLFFFTSLWAPVPL